MTSSYKQPLVNTNPNIKKVAILFAGGPAPAANAVISTAAASFLKAGIEVVGIKHGSSNLADFNPSQPLVEGKHYVKMTPEYLSRTRSSQGIMLGTARTNPGKKVSHPDHLKDAELTAPMRRTYEALRSIGVDALVSIGGDDTLKTANKMKLFQDHLPADMKRMPVVHLPKTIDNDYHGIDFTFGFFTAAEFLATEIRNMIYDAAAGRAYFIAETMGRSAGWLGYAAAIAGEASLAISVEDVAGEYATTETVTDPVTGKTRERRVMNFDAIIGLIVDTMVARDKAGKEFGVIVVAEGLGELLPMAQLAGIPRDDHGHIAMSEVNLNRLFAKEVAKAYKARTGKDRKINGVQLGYECRCAKPLAYDVILGSQLGVGAYRALIEEKLNGVMVSVSGQFQLRYVPLEELVDPATLVTLVRHIIPGRDFHRLARFLETHLDG